MKTFVVTLKSTANYSQSKHYDEIDVPALTETETKDQYEARTWRHRCNTTNDGHVFIPPTAFKLALSTAASHLSMSVPGKNRATYTKYFVRGVSISDPLVLDAMAADVESERLFVPSDGKKGGGHRVMKTFPLIREWEGKIKVIVLEDLITKDILLKHLKIAGVLIGVGRFRPENGGYYGRFEVVDIQEEAA